MVSVIVLGCYCGRFETSDGVFDGTTVSSEGREERKSDGT